MIGGRRKQGYIGFDENNVQDMQDLDALGFNEGNIELVFNYYNVSNIDELIDIYLYIANGPPFNLNWTTREMAVSSPYNLGIYKTSGIEYDKHDIVDDVIHFLEQQNNPGIGGRKKTRKQRKLKGKRRRKTHRRKYYSRKHKH